MIAQWMGPLQCGLSTLHVQLYVVLGLGCADEVVQHPLQVTVGAVVEVFRSRSQNVLINSAQSMASGELGAASDRAVLIVVPAR